jgi:hypothetical protein
MRQGCARRAAIAIDHLGRDHDLDGISQFETLEAGTASRQQAGIARSLNEPRQIQADATAAIYTAIAAKSRLGAPCARS